MSRINPTVRGFAIILLIAVGIWLLQLQTALFSLLLLARIAFFLAIAFFLFLLWRERRGEIAMWSASSRAVFYGAVGLAVVNVGAAILAPYPSGSLEVLVFIFVLVACGYSLWRVWRREHTYGYWAVWAAALCRAKLVRPRAVDGDVRGGRAGVVDAALPAHPLRRWPRIRLPWAKLEAGRIGPHPAAMATSMRSPQPQPDSCKLRAIRVVSNPGAATRKRREPQPLEGFPG